MRNGQISNYERMNAHDIIQIGEKIEPVSEIYQADLIFPIVFLSIIIHRNVELKSLIETSEKIVE